MRDGGLMIDADIMYLHDDRLVSGDDRLSGRLCD